MTRIAGIIPVFNQVRWVEAAVTSMLAEVDELVVVDDASTDGTVPVLESLREQHGFTLVLQGQTAGVSAACNTAMRAVTAEIVLLQGGDDRTLPGRGERSRSALDDPAVSLVYSLPTVIDADDHVLPADAAQEFEAGSSLDDPIRYLFTVGNVICAPSTAFRRADYLDKGGFPEGIDLLQDYALWLQLASVGRLERVEEPLVEYRKHATNLSREYTGIDTLRQRRHAAELAWVRNRFLDSAPSSVMERIGAVGGLASSSPLDRDDLALLVRLGHSSRPLIRRGLDDLFTRVAEEGLAVLDRFGLERADLDRLAALADHDGLAELGRAAATVRALTGRTADDLPAVRP